VTSISAELSSSKDQMMEAIIRAGVTDPRVLSAMENTPRELFMAPTFVERAYENNAVPIGHHQTISQPEVVALMSEALNVGERSKVLELGTGSGYQSAILAPLCRRLYTTERIKDLHTVALQRFQKLEIRNITAVLADGSLGWPEQAPFDRIIVTAAAVDVPPLLLEQLVIGGIMVIPVGLADNDQRLIRVVRTEEGAETEDLGGVRFVPLLPGLAGN